MKPERYEYEGHHIELRQGKDKPELFIDNAPVPYGQLPNGLYFLHKYAYDWTDNLVDLARKFIAYRQKVNKIHIEHKKGGK